MKGITPGNWEYKPSQSRQVVSDTGDTICKVHRGKKAQFNGPLIAAAPDLLDAIEDLLQMTQDCDEGQYMDYPGACIVFDNAKEAIAKAKGEQG